MLSLSAADDFFLFYFLSFQALMCSVTLSSFDACGKMQRDLFSPLWD